MITDSYNVYLENASGLSKFFEICAEVRLPVGDSCIVNVLIFLGQVFFCKNTEVLIFWTSPVFRKGKSPDFSDQCCFFQNQSPNFQKML